MAREVISQGKTFPTDSRSYLDVADTSGLHQASAFVTIELQASIFNGSQLISR
jgi:hypothetical protein